MLKDVETLALRGATGGLMTGHGAQKLFGAFDGPGFKGTAGFMESMGLQPGHYWGMAAGLSEFGGGVLTTLGFLHPLGPIGIISSMSMGWGKVHWGKPIWGSSGGGELPATNIAICLALIMAGPGKYSLDRAFGIKLPGWIGTVAALTATGAIAYGLSQQPAPRPSPAEQSGGDAHEGAAGAQPGSDQVRSSGSDDPPQQSQGGGDTSPV